VARLPSNLPAILRGVGLTVEVLPGWESNGRPGSFNPKGGVLDHHTGSADYAGDPKNDLAYAKWLAFSGRSDLPAPLCQLALSAEGVVYVCAAGRANHAGKAKASGTMVGGDGNGLYIGIEAMNSGSQGWTKKQYDAYVLLNAALCVYVTGNSEKTVRGHKETSVTGKWDPGAMDMAKMRRDVKAKIAELKAGKTQPKAPKVTSHTRWATRETGVYDKIGGKVLRMIPAGYSFGVIDGSGSGKGGWIETTSHNWVNGNHTDTKKFVPEPKTFRSDIKAVVANVKSNPLLSVAKAKAEYERVFEGARQIGAQAVMLNEYVDSYKSALFTTAKEHGFVVVEKGGLATAYRDNEWDESGKSYVKVVGGVKGISPNRGVLKVGNTTPGQTRVVFDNTMFPRGWNNKKYAEYATTHKMGEALAKGIGRQVENQTVNLNSAALVAGDMNQTGAVNWKGLTGLSPAAYAIQPGGALDKMMQAYLFVPKGWSAEVVKTWTFGKQYTDHGIFGVHFRVTRPV
jgi:hypothetical protein